jgi:hypothetical protein
MGRRYSRFGALWAERARRVAVRMLWPDQPVQPQPLAGWRQAKGIDRDAMVCASHPEEPLEIGRCYWRCRVTYCEGEGCGGGQDGEGCGCPDVLHDCSDRWFEVRIDWSDADGRGRWRSHGIPLGGAGFREFVATLTDADRDTAAAERPRMLAAHRTTLLEGIAEVDRALAYGLLSEGVADGLRRGYREALARLDAEIDAEEEP